MNIMKSKHLFVSNPKDKKHGYFIYLYESDYENVSRQVNNTISTSAAKAIIILLKITG